MQILFDASYGKNGIYISLRVVTIIALSLLIGLIAPRTITSFATVQDIAIPALVGIAGLIVLTGVIGVKGLRLYAPYVIFVADWALVGTYVYFIGHSDLLLISAILSAVIVSGILRTGSRSGWIHIAGSYAAAGLALALQPAIGFDRLLNNYQDYLPAFIITLLMGTLALAWYNVLDEENSINRLLIRKEIEDTRTRLKGMQQRAKSFSDMAANLNSTLNYDHVLDTAMSISRLSLRHDPSQRIVSLALMIDPNDELVIATSRGIAHVDENLTFKGSKGIIAETIEQGQPIIKTDGKEDPELRELRSFADIKTIVCIPLRSNYETYGVVVFGSTLANAIDKDEIDTLAAIGVQTAIALQNAVLFGTVREEKERIIRIEENGRKALVRDLHDIPTQTVSAIAMQLSVIPMIVEKEPQKLRQEVENIRKMALRASEEIRHVMFSLRPLALETQGLSAALQQLAEKMHKTYKQAMEIRVDPVAEASLSQDAQGTLFYLIEEAANNARKYAAASMIKVQVAVDHGQGVIVRVQDNGKGFDMETVGENYENRGSFGMVNMRERAELIDGNFELYSEPGRGTTVTVRIPTEIDDTKPITSTKRPKAAKPRKSLVKQQKKKQYSGPLSPGR